MGVHGKVSPILAYVRLTENWGYFTNLLIGNTVEV